VRIQDPLLLDESKNKSIDKRTSKEEEGTGDLERNERGGRGRVQSQRKDDDKKYINEKNTQCPGDVP
jgi:hypothetical protein